MSIISHEKEQNKFMCNYTASEAQLAPLCTNFSGDGGRNAAEPLGTCLILAAGKTSHTEGYKDFVTARSGVKRVFLKWPLIDKTAHSSDTDIVETATLRLHLVSASDCPHKRYKQKNIVSLTFIIPVGVKLNPQSVKRRLR